MPVLRTGPEICLEPIPLSYMEIVQFQGVQR